MYLKRNNMDIDKNTVVSIYSVSYTHLDVYKRQELSGFEVEVENDGTSGLARALAEDFDLDVYKRQA